MNPRGSCSFDEFVLARGDALLRFAWMLSGDEHLAQDVVQEVLARASSRWRRLEQASSPEAYVRRMIVNELHSWRRRRRDVPTGAVPETPALGTHAGDPAGDQADRDEVVRLLATLPPQQKAVLVLRYFEGLDDFAISEIVGCAPVTVRAHASKGLARLRVTVTRVKELR